MKDIDEVIGNVEKVHIERLNDKCISIVIYHHGGRIETINISSDADISVEGFK